MIFTCLSLAHKTIGVKIVFRLRLDFTITRAWVRANIHLGFFKTSALYCCLSCGELFFVWKKNLSFFSRDSGEPFSLSNGSCEMILFRNNSQGEIIRVCMGIFMTALKNKKIGQMLNENTSPYFHSTLPVIWPLTSLKGIHLSELYISRFSTHIRKAFLICMYDCVCDLAMTYEQQVGK